MVVVRVAGAVAGAGVVQLLGPALAEAATRHTAGNCLEQSTSCQSPEPPRTTTQSCLPLVLLGWPYEDKYMIIKHLFILGELVKKSRCHILSL